MSCCNVEQLDDLGQCEICGEMNDTELLELINECGEPRYGDIKNESRQDKYGYLNHHGGYYLWKQQEDEKC